MIRRLRLLAATLFTLSCALYVQPVFAVGMSELDLRSALNQRFDAEIELTNVGTLEIDEILPNLASQEDFDRVGVDRNYQLTDLRFKVRLREDGKYVVNVSSSKPIIEPFLNFIVEVIWPTGRILREYTVLLDPPVFGSDGVEKIEPGSVSSLSPSAPSSGKSTQRRQIPAAPSVSSGRVEGVVTEDDEYGLTGPGDTLWTIALKVRPSGSVSVQQTMLALQRANPEAFINNNINLLKAGHVLRIPDLNEIRAETTTEAIAEVRVQNEEFQEYKTGDVAQLDARRTSRRDSSSRESDDDGELKLLAADRSGSRAGADDSRAEELENSLAVAREDLDRARRANSELNVRLDDLAGQVETLNEIVKLKDDQLAELRAELQRAANAEATAQSAPATPPVTTQQTQSASLLDNPMVLGGLGVLLIGGIAAGLILMRKRRQTAELDDDEFAPASIDEPVAELSLNDEMSASDDAGDAADDEDEDVTQQTSDVIGEAEIYIAYGRFPQAISFLQNAIESEPDRADIQLKLLEVFVQTEDATAFNLQFEQLRMLGDEDAISQATELQSQIPGAAETAAASMDATIVSSEPIEAIAEPADDDDDLSFDLDDLDAETEDDDLDLGGDELSHDEAMELGDADLDLDLDAALEDVAADDDDEDLDLDLDLDDEIDLDFEDGDGELDETLQLDAEQAVDSPVDDDVDLDLSDDLDLDDDLDLGDAAEDSDTLDLSGDDDALDLGDLDDGDELDLGDLEDDALDLGDLEDDDGALDLTDDADELDLGDLDDDDAIELDLGDDDALSLDDDDAIELDLGDDDDALSLDDDGAIELDLGDDDDLDLGDTLELDGDSLELGDDSLELDDDSLELDDDSLELGDDDLDLDDDGLDLDDDDSIELDLDADDDFDIGELEDDDLGELNLDEDASSKLDLARAYVEMGDSDGARALLDEVVNEGSDEEVAEANELIGKLD